MNGTNWPVYKGESFHLWRPDTKIYYASIDPQRAVEHLQSKRKRQLRYKRSAFYGRSDTDDPATLPCHQARVAFRDVTNAVDSSTIIVALIPPKVVPTNAAPYLLWPESATAKDEAYLLGVLSTMVCEWYARRVVILHLNFHIFNNIPIPDPHDNQIIADRVIQIAGTLAVVDDRFADWAAEVGVPVGTATDNNPEYKQQLIEELDACVALLYGLDEDDLACLYETFHETTDYIDRHRAVLAHFRRLSASQEQDSLTTSDDTTSDEL